MLIVNVFKLFPKVTPDIVDAANLLTAIAAELFISAFTITPVAIVVALPTEVISPVKLAFVVTVDANVAVAALPVVFWFHVGTVPVNPE